MLRSFRPVFAGIIGALVLIGLAFAQTQTGWLPAKYLGGGVPQLPRLTTIGGGQVVLEVTVDEAGNATAVRPLKTTPPFAALLATEAQGWRFSPAIEERVDPARPDGRARVAVASKVAVIGMYRPPVLRGPTLGAQPKDTAVASDDVAYPLNMVMPRYPPTARSGGQVLVEALIGPDGAVGETKLLQAQPPFESAALGAMAEWKFKPAIRGGLPVSSYVYVLFGFPEIVGNK